MQHSTLLTTISNRSNDPLHPISRIIQALNCIKLRDEHLAADLIQIEGAMLELLGENDAWTISVSSQQPTEQHEH